MRAKACLLPTTIAVVVIIIQPGLADPDDPRMTGGIDQPGGVDVRMLVRLMRMNTDAGPDIGFTRSEEHTSELQSLMRISYAVFCLKKKNSNKSTNKQQH